MIGIQDRKRQKQRKVKIGIRCITRNKSGDYRSQYSAQIENVESERTPFVFERVPYQPIKIERDHQDNQIRRIGNKYKGKDAPYLPFQDCGFIERQISGKAYARPHINEIV